MSGIFSDPSRWMDDELLMFEESAAKILASTVSPERLAAWREAGLVERSAWNELGAAGLLGISLGSDHGGAGGDFRHEAVLIRSIGLAGLDGWSVPLHNAICGTYFDKFGTEEQRARWLPGIVSGELVTAIAMTEPGTGSDLQSIKTTARRSGNGYVLNGQKTFITNGQNADLIIVVAKTDPAAGSRGISLVVVETAKAEGFTRGRNLDKIGHEIADTSELFFDDVHVPADNLLGMEEGQGLYQLMKELPKERLIIAIECMTTIEAALRYTIPYVQERKAFGKRLLDFQNTQFVLAECKTEAAVCRAFLDDCIERYIAGTLDATTASMTKYWLSERAQKVVDACLQLFGGYGYMNEYPIAQLYKDVRVKRIYGGTTEIMKLLIARSLEQ